jgi:hypothetical protein
LRYNFCAIAASFTHAPALCARAGQERETRAPRVQSGGFFLTKSRVPEYKTAINLGFVPLM